MKTLARSKIKFWWRNDVLTSLRHNFTNLITRLIVKILPRNINSVFNDIPHSDHSHYEHVISLGKFFFCYRVFWYYYLLNYFHSTLRRSAAVVVKLLVGGGADANHGVSKHRILNDLDDLIEEIRFYNPLAKIIISELTHRGYKRSVNEKVDHLNVHIRKRGMRGDHVFTQAPCPTEPHHYSKYDKSYTHFSPSGQTYLADNINAIITNFLNFVITAQI